MKFRLVLALSFAILLIGVASWSRFAPTLGKQSYIAVVDQPSNYDAYSEELLQDFTDPSDTSDDTVISSTLVVEEPLTKTDIVSRNLLLSYLNLAASGNVGETNIDALANQYVEEALKAHTFTRAGALDIKVVPDSAETVAKYSTSLSSTYVTAATEMSGITAGTPNSPTAYVGFANSAAKIYGNLALAFKNMQVPISFAALHLELTNIHLSNQAAMISAVNMEEDPVTAVAGLIAVKENVNEEKIILEKIKQNLKDKWGIIY